MNTYVVWRYLGHGKNSYEWSGCGLLEPISLKTILPVWQVEAPTLHQAINGTKRAWNRRNGHSRRRTRAGNEAPEVVQ